MVVQQLCTRLEVVLRVALSRSYSRRCCRYECLERVAMCMLEGACLRGSKWVSFYLPPKRLLLSPVLCILLLLLRHTDIFFTSHTNPITLPSLRWHFIRP